MLLAIHDTICKHSNKLPMLWQKITELVLIHTNFHYIFMRKHMYIQSQI